MAATSRKKWVLYMNKTHAHLRNKGTLLVLQCLPRLLLHLCRNHSHNPQKHVTKLTQWAQPKKSSVVVQTNEPERRQEKFERGQRWSLLDNKFNVQDNRHHTPPAILALGI